MQNRYTVKEFDTFTCGKTVDRSGFHALDPSTFGQLETFVLENSGLDELDDTSLFMTLSNMRGIGKVIRVRNYIGLLKMKDGTEIEILPKIHSPEKEHSEEEVKRIALDMLSSLPDIPNKKANKANMDLSDDTLLEIFIKMFIDEVQWLVKRGLKSTYEEVEGNQPFFKGKLQISQHIRYNLAHKERFYITYDQLSVNGVENRLIRAALLNARSKSSNPQNRKSINELLEHFQVADITDYKQAFRSIDHNRSTQMYGQALRWCRVFLDNKSFTVFSGSTLSFALLFPMEKVFENYISQLLKLKLRHLPVKLRTQDRRFYLFDDPRRFQLQPDIVLQKEDQCMVMDTKWKILKNKPDINFGISQADMYQMYAYHQKYNAECIVMIYPWSAAFEDHAANSFCYRSGDQRVVILLFHLGEVERSLADLMEIVNECSIN
ncbi:McrC family protein [Sporosarcina sp.]|uniref:McrC family protein n=1 Tax=Sporosarcina sp. TaxID=49982 RepID=UPI002603F733|nr:McrC family protein [Sporosarcina sp.]